MTSTHDLSIDTDLVRKRFVSWARGEPDREWDGLTALDRLAPGLAPRPIRRETDDGAPVVVMSRVPGEPLGGERVTAAQTRALATSLQRLFAATPDAGLPEREFGPTVIRSQVRGWAAETYDLNACQQPETVRRALTTLREWLDEDDPEHDRVVDRVLARGDGNLANVLWDGETCRFVDFEEFGVSDLTYELADVVEHASSRLQGLLDVPDLLSRFDLSPARQRRLTVHRQLLAGFWLVMLLPANGGFHRNPAGSTELQADHLLALLGRNR